MPINQLPESAKVIFNNMTDELEESYNRVLSLQRRIKDIDLQLGNAGEGVDLRPYHDELKRQHARLGTAQAEHAQLARIHAAVRSWIQQLNIHAQFEEVGPHRINLMKGETHAEVIAGLRAQIEDLTGKRNEAIQAVPPTDDLYAQADIFVDGLVNQACPRILLRDGKLDIRFPTDRTTLPMLAWVDPEAFKERLRESIDAQRQRDLMGGHTVMDTSLRKATIGGLTEKIVTLERKEEVAIRDAAANGITIPRRESASPMAILSIRPAVTKKAQAA